jgi:hypothetical protein
VVAISKSRRLRCATDSSGVPLLSEEAIDCQGPRATQNKGCEAGALASCGLCCDRAPLGPDDSEQIPFAYGSNAERLIAAKKRFDQDDVFSSATPLRVR